MQLSADHLFLTISKTNPELAQQCRNAFLNPEKELGINETESSPCESTSSDAASVNERKSNCSNKPPNGMPVSRRMIPRTLPLYQRASLETILGTVIRLGFLFGHVLEPERAYHLARILEAAYWTIAELENVEKLIPSVKDLARQVAFDRTISPVVFAVARDHPEMLRYRLIDIFEARHYCRQNDVPINEAFEIVFVEGVTMQNSRLKPFWLLK